MNQVGLYKGYQGRNISSLWRGKYNRPSIVVPIQTLPTFLLVRSQNKEKIQRSRSSVLPGMSTKNWINCPEMHRDINGSVIFNKGTRWHNEEETRSL